MVVNGVGGAPMESMNLMGWVSEISSGKVFKTLDLSWVIGPRLVLGMM